MRIILYEHTKFSIQAQLMYMHIVPIYLHVHVFNQHKNVERQYIHSIIPINMITEN